MRRALRCAGYGVRMRAPTTCINRRCIRASTTHVPRDLYSVTRGRSSVLSKYIHTLRARALSARCESNLQERGPCTDRKRRKRTFAHCTLAHSHSAVVSMQVSEWLCSPAMGDEHTVQASQRRECSCGHARGDGIAHSLVSRKTPASAMRSSTTSLMRASAAMH